MKFAVLVYSGQGVVVYDGGSDPAKLGEILQGVEAAVDFPVAVAVLHTKRDLPGVGKQQPSPLGSRDSSGLS